MQSDASERLSALQRHHASLRECRDCPGMEGPPVAGRAVLSPVMLMGQAPGTREIREGRPFAWTAGKTLFGWFAGIGLEEDEFRERVAMTAVCRCFPGKTPKGGDRVPNRTEVFLCKRWWCGELELVRPRLLIPVGRIAIALFLEGRRLDEVVGRQWPYQWSPEYSIDLIPLPHPSGASTWFKRRAGQILLGRALSLIAEHPAWRSLLTPGHIERDM